MVRVKENLLPYEHFKISYNLPTFVHTVSSWLHFFSVMLPAWAHTVPQMPVNSFKRQGLYIARFDEIKSQPY